MITKVGGLLWVNPGVWEPDFPREKIELGDYVRWATHEVGTRLYVQQNRQGLLEMTLTLRVEHAEHSHILMDQCLEFAQLPDTYVVSVQNQYSHKEPEVVWSEVLVHAAQKLTISVDRSDPRVLNFVLFILGMEIKGSSSITQLQPFLKVDYAQR